MTNTPLDEAEIQVLASIQLAEKQNSPTDSASLVSAGARYWIFQEDWHHAFETLLTRGFIEADDSGYHLTDTGRPLGEQYAAQRPDMYWYYYQRFYPAASASKAHSRLCERVFGLDLTQEGMADMTAIHHLLQLLEPREGEHMLDLGCGAGVIAEYIAGKTGVQVTGLDFAEQAISEAIQRTENKKDTLSFITGDMNDLHFPANSFDSIISIDSLYWVEDLNSTISQMASLLKAGGQMGIFMLQHAPDGRTAADVSGEETTLGKVLTDLGLSFDSCDYTIQNIAFWHRNYQAAQDLKSEFEAEGNGFIPASLIRESENDFLPFIEKGTLCRFLYHVRK